MLFILFYFILRGEKQEVFILQNNIQLILTSYNIFGRIGNLGIC